MNSHAGAWELEMLRVGVRVLFSGSHAPAWERKNGYPTFGLAPMLRVGVRVLFKGAGIATFATIIP